MQGSQHSLLKILFRAARIACLPLPRFMLVSALDCTTSALNRNHNEDLANALDMLATACNKQQFPNALPNASAAELVSASQDSFVALHRGAHRLLKNPDYAAFAADIYRQAAQTEDDLSARTNQPTARKQTVGNLLLINSRNASCHPDNRFPIARQALLCVKDYFNSGKSPEAAHSLYLAALDQTINYALQYPTPMARLNALQKTLESTCDNDPCGTDAIKRKLQSAFDTNAPEKDKLRILNRFLDRHTLTERRPLLDEAILVIVDMRSAPTPHVRGNGGKPPQAAVTP